MPNPVGSEFVSADPFNIFTGHPKIFEHQLLEKDNILHTVINPNSELFPPAFVLWECRMFIFLFAEPRLSQIVEGRRKDFEEISEQDIVEN